MQRERRRKVLLSFQMGCGASSQAADRAVVPALDAVAGKNALTCGNAAPATFNPLSAAGRPPASDHMDSFAPTLDRISSASVQPPQSWRPQRPLTTNVQKSATDSETTASAWSTLPVSAQEMLEFELPPTEDCPSEKVLPLPAVPSALAHQEDDLDDTDRSEGELQVSPVETPLEVPKRGRHARKRDAPDGEERSLPLGGLSPDWAAVLSSTAPRRRRRQLDEATDSESETSSRQSSVTFVLPE
jgi:hypothetical protein